MSEGNVEHIDFGKDQREAARRLSGLLGLIEARDREMLENPKKFFDMAADEIVRLQGVLRAAQDALRVPMDIALYRQDSPITFCPLETWIVDKAEWERLKAVERIIDAADR